MSPRPETTQVSGPSAGKLAGAGNSPDNDDDDDKTVSPDNDDDDDKTVSFIERCHKHLNKSRFYVYVEVIRDQEIQNHKKCFQHYMSHTVDDAVSHAFDIDSDLAFMILEDRIHYANHCYSFY